MSFASLKRIVSTTSFRLTFFSLTLLWLLVGLLLGGIYLVTRDLMESETIEQLVAETEMLDDWIDDRSLSSSQLITQLQQEDGLLILFSPQREVLYSSVERFEVLEREEGGILTLSAPTLQFAWQQQDYYPDRWQQDDTYSEDISAHPPAPDPEAEAETKTDSSETDAFETTAGQSVYYALATEFDDGRALWIGRDIGYLRDLIGLLETILWISWGLMLLLLTAVSILITRRALQRIDTINATCSAIEAGSLQLRIACREDGDEYDRLSTNINHMLDRIAMLLEDVKRVSDQVAHELRTPLTRLHAQVTMLCDNPDNTRIQQQTGSEIERLLSTFNTLLRISRIESGAIELTDSGETDLTKLLNDLLELYQPLLEEAGGELLAELPAEPVLVAGDPSLWFQCFSNLLDNSLKYCPAPVSIRIVIAEGSPLQICFSDNGPGIAPAYRQQVLSRFFRLPRDHGQSGHGLGLAFVDAVCRYHRVRLSLCGDSGLSVRLQWPEHNRPRSPSA